MADDTRVTRVRRGLLLALPLVCLCVALPARSGADDVAPAPNDPGYVKEWGLASAGAPGAWRYSTGAGITVAVIDTGVDAAHEDLTGQIAPGGWGVADPSSDDVGHGTQVAGVIAATKGNGLGIAGVAPDASILPIRAFMDTDSVSVDALVDAMDRAGDSGARVVNLSLSTDPMDPSWRDTSTVARRMKSVLKDHQDTLYVAAAGNAVQGTTAGTDNDEEPVFPCSAEATNLICVGAYEQAAGGEQPFAAGNYGDVSVDLLAPGRTIWSTTNATSGYGYFSGTSAAAPFVSAEAALLFSKVPRLSPQGAISLILSTARYNPSFAGKAASSAGPDAAAALRAAIVDSDSDGVYDVVDGCPGQAFRTVTGCPDPTPTPTPSATPSATAAPTATPTPVPRTDPVPRVRSMSAKVTRCKQGKTCKNATVRLTPDRAAKVSLRIEVKSCDKRGRHCKWKGYTTKAFTASTRGASIVIRGKSAKKGLPKGNYRVIAVLSSSGGAAKPVTRTFRVR
jgi:subtilisin family serine protease